MPSGKALPRSVKNLRPQHMTGLSGHTPKTKASAPACQGRSNTPRYHFACCVKTATLPRMVHWPCCPITWAGRHHATWGHKTRFTQAARRRGSSAPDCRFFTREAARWKRVMQKIMSCSLHLLN